MAEYYVYSGATGAADGSSWADAFTSLATAFSGKAAGDVFYVADDHAQTQASFLSLASPGTVDAPCQVLCVLRSGGSVPPVAADLRTTATITTTGNNGIQLSGSAYYYGMQITCGGSSASAPVLSFGLSNTVPSIIRLERCLLKLAATGNSTLAFPESGNINNRSAIVELVDTQLEFSATGQTIRLGGADFVWKSVASPVLGTIPTTLFSLLPTTKSCNLLIKGVDFSSIGSGKNLFLITAGLIHQITVENCKLNASASLTTGTHAGFGGVNFKLINCDSSDTNYRYQKTDGAGDVTNETTIVRTGGASDGTTPISRKMVSSSRTQYYAPLSFDIMFWNETTGSQLSLAAEVISDNVTFTDKELWMEVEALTTSGFPLSSFTNDAAATILTAGVNQATSTVTWTTTGLTTPVKQKLEVNVTPQEKGWVRCRINLAKPSSTVYVCPLITGIGYTSGRQWQTSDAYLIEGGGTGGGVRIPNIRGGADQ